MYSYKFIIYSGLAAAAWVCSSLVPLQAATDPGVRPGAADAGGPLTGLTAEELNAFTIAVEAFEEIDSVNGMLPGEEDAGLGPTFNLNGCAGCHAFPAMGGTSPRTNPQIALATAHGARNTVPSFITSTGPIREARFKRNADGTPDGGVHAIYVITGREDAPAGFNLPQTNFEAQLAANNIIFRIPTPVYGAGLIEAITDEAILANQAADAAGKAALGIKGHPNRSGNVGTITRFGWKAQNPSLFMFAGEAYNAEQGITNDLFPHTRELNGRSFVTAMPESTLDLATDGIGDVEQFAIFMKFLAAPTPRTPPGVNNGSVTAGGNHFNKIGCAQCHTPSLSTSLCTVAALSNKSVPLFSDLLVHKMGKGLADDIIQGLAGPDEFRTAPLWGVGQRLFLLHDGRTSDLEQAILAHASPANGPYAASEANQVVQNYLGLNDTQKQNLLNFVRSL